MIAIVLWFDGMVFAVWPSMVKNSKIHKLSNMSALHTPSSQTGAERELIVMNAECDSTASVIIVKP